MEQKICDYSNYDYKESFWNQNNRQYEHKLETSFLTDIFNRHARKKTSIIDELSSDKNLGLCLYCDFFRNFENASNL